MFSKEIWQKVGGMIPDSHAPGFVIRAPDKTSTRKSGDEAIPRHVSRLPETPLRGGRHPYFPFLDPF